MTTAQWSSRGDARTLFRSMSRRARNFFERMHSWVPFGGGPHLCIGLRFAEVQVKAIMHQMLRRWRWSVPDGYRMPVQQAPISKPLDGLPIEMRAL